MSHNGVSALQPGRKTERDPVTDRQADRQTDRQTDTQAGRQAGRQQLYYVLLRVGSKNNSRQHLTFLLLFLFWTEFSLLLPTLECNGHHLEGSACPRPPKVRG